MSNTTDTLLCVLAVIGFTCLMVGLIFPMLKRKGVDVDELLDKTNAALEVASKAFDTVKPFLPDGAGIDAFDRILEAAQVGVGNAEQLYKVGKLRGDERKQAAKNYVYDTLKLMEVEVTPEVERLVDGAIENNVLDLGHKPVMVLS